MGGGLMQLVAYGSQDIYLTGNPQITFFKIVYRRHTNFSMECIQQTISGSDTLSDTYSTTGTVTISRNGDLLSQLYVRTDQDTTSGINGDYLVEDIEIEIGGQRIDKHYREWNQIWTELTTPASKVDGLKYMTGAFSNQLVTGGTTGGTGQQSIMYPLQFWFCRNIGLAIPLIALQYHDVKLKCTWSNGSATGGVSRNGNAAVTPKVEVWADYVYLDTDERRRFAQVSHEYLIEQLQLQEEGSSRESYRINFDHPIKELIWTVPTSTTEANTIISQQIKLELNGHDRFAYQDREYFQLKHPYTYHTSIPGYNIKETENPISIQPIMIAYRDAGTATGTATSTLHNTVSATSGTKTIFNLYIGTNFIPSTSSSNFPKVGDILDIEIRDKSEIATAARFRRITAQVSSIASRTNGWDLGMIIEDDQDSISTSFIVGTTADDCITIFITGRLQLPQSRCSQLDRDIFVYSFALNPEDHQPSGTCNFSKIDSAKLLLSSSGTISNIYAINYNVLRIMSGMGGLAYAI
jgi:hypothetical protein